MLLAKAGLRTRTRITEAARDWKNAGCDPAYLFTGARLAAAIEWDASHSGELTAGEADFLFHSRAYLARQEENAARKTALHTEAMRKQVEAETRLSLGSQAPQFRAHTPGQHLPGFAPSPSDWRLPDHSIRNGLRFPDLPQLLLSGLALLARRVLWFAYKKRTRADKKPPGAREQDSSC